MLTEYDFFGHWFYFFIALGMFFISKRETYGWLFRLFGEIGWMWLGWKMQMTSIFMWGCLFLLIDFNGFFTWRKEEKEMESKKGWLEEQAQWLAAGVQALEKVDEGLENNEGFWMAAGDLVEEKKVDETRKSKTKNTRRTRKATTRKTTSRTKKMRKVQGKVRKASRRN